MDSIEAIISQLVAREPTTLATGCLEWPYDPDGGGYGRAILKGQRKRVHVLIYEHLVGPIPPGYEIHHRCRNRACGNKEHLEMLTRQEHGERHRRTHCPQGHPYATESRQRSGKQGGRDCRICHREREYQRGIRKAAQREYVRGPYKKTRLRRPITPEKVIEVRRLAAAGVRQCEISRRLDLSQSHVCQIVSRRSWRDLSD
jgi:hypothetical protein